MTDRRVPDFKFAAWVPMSIEMAADRCRTWQERVVLMGHSDPNPFPRFHLFRRTRP